MGKWQRLREYAETHGVRYTVRRCGEKLGQVALGTWDRRWKREKASEDALRFQRENPPKAGLISVVVPVYNTKPAYLKEMMDSLRSQSYPRWEAILYDGGSTRPETVSLLDREAAGESRFRVIHAPFVKSGIPTGMPPALMLCSERGVIAIRAAVS